MYQSLFIHSPTEGHLGCFHILVNKTAIKIHVNAFVFMCFRLVGINTKENDFLVTQYEYIYFCKKLSNFLLKQLYHFELPSAIKQSSCCSTFSPAFDGISILNCGHSNRCVVVSNFWVIFQFFNVI